MFRCSESEKQKDPATTSIPDSPEIVHGKQIIIPSFPIVSDTDSDSNTGELTDDNDEDMSPTDHKISNTDTIIHMLKVRMRYVYVTMSICFIIAGKYWDWDTGHARCH